MYEPKKQQPVAVCTECGAFGYTMRYIGERCGKPQGGNRCAGVRGRATDWSQLEGVPEMRSHWPLRGRRMQYVFQEWLALHSTRCPTGELVAN
jgi:hypothetical protein